MPQAPGRGDATPVLVLTARDAIDDRVTGLEVGADDYLVKPFGLRELMARVPGPCCGGPSRVTTRWATPT